MTDSSDWSSVEAPQGQTLWITHFVIIALYNYLFLL